MIIDNHVHVFPDQGGSAGYADVHSQLDRLQGSVGRFWGRMLTSHDDPKFIPEPNEEVGFYVGKFGRYHWTKFGEECWLQRGPVALERMEHTADQMIAQMDFVGVDKAVILSDYVEPNFGRQTYFTDAINRYPDRLIGSVAIQYDLQNSTEYLLSEINKLTHAVEVSGFRALHRHLPKGQPLDDKRCDALWKEVVRLGIPVYMDTGFNSKTDYMDEIQRIENVLRNYPELIAIDCHLGANVRHPTDPEFVENPKEFFKLFKLGRFHLEVGYVLAYENWGVWGQDYEYPYPRHAEIIRQAYENFGPQVLVWGSDMPWTMRTCTYQQNLDLIRLHTDYMSEQDRSLILGGNIAKAFGIT